MTHITSGLIVDPEEAKREFGESVVSLMKLSEDGTKVLWPQPSDDPNDPQNVSPFSFEIRREQVLRPI